MLYDVVVRIPNKLDYLKYKINYSLMNYSITVQIDAKSIQYNPYKKKLFVWFVGCL